MLAKKQTLPITVNAQALLKLIELFEFSCLTEFPDSLLLHHRPCGTLCSFVSTTKNVKYTTSVYTMLFLCDAHFQNQYSLILHCVETSHTAQPSMRTDRISIRGFFS